MHTYLCKMSFNVCFILVIVLQSSNSLSSQYRVALFTFALTLLCMFQLLLLHIEYWAFRCTDQVIGLPSNALVVELKFAVQIRLYFCHLDSKFWLFKNPCCSTWVLSCPGHVEGTQRLNFWCCFSGKMTAYLKRLFCNLQYKNVCILVGFGPILSF